MPTSLFDPTYAPAGPWFTPTGSPTGTPSHGAMSAVSPATSYALAQRRPSYLGSSAPRPVVNGRPLTDEEMQALEAYFGALADEDARRWDKNYGLQERGQRFTERNAADDRAARLREIQMRIDADRYQFDRRLSLDRDALALDRDRLGADILKTGAGMRGARDWIQGDMYAQGISNGFSPYLQSLRTGTAGQYGGGTATQGNPTPLTVGTLAAAMSGGNAGTDQYGRPNLSPQAQEAVNATARVYERGIANQPLGWWENMTDDQRDAFASQSDYLGRNTRSELQYLKRSRPGQGSALAA